MKSYDEFAEEVFREADRRLALKKKRAAVIRRYTFAFASMFAIILTSIFVIKNETVREALEKKFNSRNIITDDADISTSPANTTTSAPESHEKSVTTVSVTYPHGDISETTATAKTSGSTTARTTAASTEHSHIPPTTTTAAGTARTTAAIAGSSDTATTAVRTTRTTSIGKTTAPTTTTTIRNPHTTSVRRTTTTSTSKTTIRTTRTTSVRKTTTTSTSKTTTKTTRTTFIGKTTTSTTTTTTRATRTTSFGKTTTSTSTTTMRTTRTTSFGKTTTSLAPATTTTTAVTSTTVTQPLYPDVELPPETADPSGTVTVPVTYFCAGEMSGSDSLGKQIGVIMIESGGTEYECGVYSMGGFDTMDRVVIYINGKWMVYWAV